MDNLESFRKAVKLAIEGAGDEFLANLPADWPIGVLGVAEALNTAGEPAGERLIKRAHLVDSLRPEPKHHYNDHRDLLFEELR